MWGVDKIEGPVYCRILRGSVPRLFNTPLKIGDIESLIKVMILC